MPKAQMNLPGQSDTEKPVPFTVEDWGSLDTKARRPAISPKDFYWIENWMPIGPGNMRTLYAEDDTPIYTVVSPRTVINFGFYNILSDRYCIVFLDNGTAVQIKLSDLSTVTVTATSGTFWSTGNALPAFSQYQSKYLAICSEETDNSYWVWDGAKLFGTGTLSPEVIITGSGKNYTSGPTVTAYGGTGTGATFSTTIANGFLTEVKVTNPGGGYLIDELVTLVITGGGSNDQARATATVTTSSGGVGLVQVTVGGSAYSAPLVTFSGGGGTGAKAFVSGAANGVVTDITVTDPGSGYTSAPTVAIADSGGGSGSGATAIAQTRRGQITAITVNSGGSGYTAMPDIVISSPNDVEFPSIQAEAYATVTAGAISAITLTNKGIGYKSATIEIEGGNNAASAEIKIMPFGISGTTLETYQSRVWVAEPTKYSYTAASSVTDFSTAGGGGSKPVIDSYLRERIVRLAQANGFLYRGGDSSLNVISNIQTSSQGVTTFNDANVDPQVGTAWRDSMAPFGRALVFANPSGVYALYGGSAEKVSGQLDGLFAAASFNTPGMSGLTPTAAVATIFGIRVYMLLFTTIDPRDATTRDLICMWDGQKWFVSSQLVQPAQLAYQEIDSELTAYGTDGTHIYKLFQTPSEDLSKVFITKLASSPNYMYVNKVQQCYFIARVESGISGTLDIALESETAINPAYQRDVFSGLQFVNDADEDIDFTGLAAAPITFTSPGLVVQGFDAEQFGALIGATVSTFVPDLTMISLTILMGPYAGGTTLKG